MKNEGQKNVWKAAVKADRGTPPFPTLTLVMAGWEDIRITERKAASPFCLVTFGNLNAM